jgi:hypothetical protein
VPVTRVNADLLVSTPACLEHEAQCFGTRPLLQLHSICSLVMRDMADRQALVQPQACWVLMRCAKHALEGYATRTIGDRAPVCGEPLQLGPCRSHPTQHASCHMHGVAAVLPRSAVAVCTGKLSPTVHLILAVRHMPLVINLLPFACCHAAGCLGRILAPATYIFCASALPALAFGQQLQMETGGCMWTSSSRSSSMLRSRWLVVFHVASTLHNISSAACPVRWQLQR